MKALELLKDYSFEKEPTETQSWEAISEKLNSSKSDFEDEILFLEKELKEEQPKHFKQELMIFQKGYGP